MGLPFGLEELEVPDSFNLTDVLDYTPSILEDSYKQFNSKQNRGVGFKKTVRTDFEDFEGMGKGQVVISDDKEKGTVTSWVPYMGKEWVTEQNQRFERAETVMNAPLYLAPLIAPFAARSTPHRTLIKQGNQQRQVGITQSGGHTYRQRSQLNRYKMQFMKSMENQRIENATNITPQRGSQIVRDVYSLKRTQPSKGLIKEGTGKYDPNVYMSPQEVAALGLHDPLQSTTGGDEPMPTWFMDQKGLKYAGVGTSDLEGLKVPENIKNDPQKLRTWYAKSIKERVLNEVLRQEGTPEKAKEIWEENNDNLMAYAKGGAGMVGAVSELNRMFAKYAEGIQVRTEEYDHPRTGERMIRWLFKDVDGKFTRWDFERVELEGVAKAYSTTTFAKDHMRPVIDSLRPGGGYFGADNEFNFEILYQFVNIQKSNTSVMPADILEAQGVPRSFSEYINMKLYPQNYEDMFVPQYWKETFQKIVLNENQKSGQPIPELAAHYRKIFEDPRMARGLEILEEEIGARVAKNMEEGVAAGTEVPEWLSMLRKPPGGWKSKNPWWTSLSEDAKTRYKYAYEYIDRTILSKPSKDRYLGNVEIPEE